MCIACHTHSFSWGHSGSTNTNPPGENTEGSLKSLGCYTFVTNNPNDFTHFPKHKLWLSSSSQNRASWFNASCSCPTGTVGFESMRIELLLEMSAGKINLRRKFINNCHFLPPSGCEGLSGVGTMWACMLGLNSSLLPYQHHVNSKARKINFPLKY